VKPIQFKEQTKVLQKPESMTDEECGTLPIWNDGKRCISCWKMSFKERLKALLYGKIWIHVLSGETQPPIAIECDKTVFIKEESDD